MSSDFLRGVYNITPTPFAPDGSLDLPSLASLTRHLLAQGVDGLTVLGVLGETDRVSDVERDRIIVTVIEAAEGRAPVCVGTTHSGTDCALQYSRRAQELGAKAVMLGPPRLVRSTDAALRAHYLRVADAIDLPIVVQDHPASSGVVMSVEFLARIADEASRCRFVKLEDEPSPQKMGQLLAANPNVRLFGGLGGVMLLEELRRGAIGTMTGFAFPSVLARICQQYFSGDVDGATATFYRYCPLIRFENQPRINVGLRKHIFQIAGVIKSAHVRAPSTPVDLQTLADLDDLLRHLGLQSPDANWAVETASRLKS